MIELRTIRSNMITFAAEPADDGGSERRMVEIVAYTGAPVQTWFGRQVVDLAGIQMSTPMPLLLEHDRTARVGVAQSAEVEERGLVLRGWLLNSPLARRIAADADEGFPFQASIGFEILDIEQVKDGDEVEVNGTRYRGPIGVIRNSRIFETSVVTVGADANTETVVMSFPRLQQEEGGVVAQVTEQAQPSERELLAQLLEAFPGDAEFAARCALEGLTVDQARARAYERAIERIRQLEARLEAHEKLAAASSAPVQFSASEQREAEERAAKPDVQSMSVDERAKWLWENDESVRSEHFSFEAFRAYLRAEAQGLARILRGHSAA